MVPGNTNIFIFFCFCPLEKVKLVKTSEIAEVGQAELYRTHRDREARVIALCGGKLCFPRMSLEG